MSPNIEGLPFAEEPGEIIGKGYQSIVKELGPDWVIKEFNPYTPDGELKRSTAYKHSQGESNIRELQESQRILQQDSIYGKSLIPVEWVLGQDEEGNKKYFTIQKRFQGETLKKSLESEDKDIKYETRFANFFNEHPELRTEMMKLMWGTKKAFVETGVFSDFHPDNIAITKDENGNETLKIFDVPNIVRTRKLLYLDPEAPVETQISILNSTEKHAVRLEKYEKWLGVTEEEEKLLNHEYKLEDNIYRKALSKILSTGEQNEQGKDLPSKVLTCISGIYPFLNQAEYDEYMENVSRIEPKNPLHEISLLVKLLHNPHAQLDKSIVLNNSDEYYSKPERQPSGELIDGVLYLKIPTFSGSKIESLENAFLPYKDVSEGMIIDLRENGGGNALNPILFAEKYFIKEGEHYEGTTVKIAPEGRLRRTDMYARAEKQIFYDKPIVILVSGKTFSATERFTATMKAGTDCVIIGTDTEGGSAGPIKYEFEYNNTNYVVSIPTWRFFLKGEEKPLEETKIKPDIPYEKDDIVDFSINYIKNANRQNTETSN